MGFYLRITQKSLIKAVGQVWTSHTRKILFKTNSLKHVMFVKDFIFGLTDKTGCHRGNDSDQFLLCFLKIFKKNMEDTQEAEWPTESQ